MTIRHIFSIPSLAIVACLAITFARGVDGQELRRIEQPHEQFASYFNEESEFANYRPSAFRLAELETEQVESDFSATQYDGNYADCCQSYGGGLAVVGGVESTFLFPIVDSGNASVLIEDNFAAFSTLYSSNQVKLDDEMMFSPRIWVGLQHCCGWGINARLFWLGDSDSAFSPDTPFFLQSHVASARLQAYTFDMEVTKNWCNYYGDPRHFAIGYRKARLEAAEMVEAHAEVNGDFVQGFAHTERYFDGSGFSLEYGGSKCCCSGIQLFFNARGSALWGTIRKSAQTTAWAFDPGVVPGTANDFSTAVAETDDVTFIGELQVGARWEHQLQCCCARAFVSTAIEYQYWYADGGFAAAGSNAFTDDAEVTALAVAGDLEMHLIGLTIGTGLTW